jgi:hypothetical protein
MGQEAATRTIPLPLDQVEVLLRDVESWSSFLVGVGSIRLISPERYIFTLSEGRGQRELKMVVRLRFRNHAFIWHGLGGAQGSVLRGSLELAPAGERQTSVTLTMFSYPADLRSGVAEMLLPHSTRAVVDLQLLERFLIDEPEPSAPGPAESRRLTDSARSGHSPVTEQVSTRPGVS